MAALLLTSGAQAQDAGCADGNSMRIKSVIVSGDEKNYLPLRSIDPGSYVYVTVLQEFAPADREKNRDLKLYFIERKDGFVQQFVLDAKMNGLIEREHLNNSWTLYVPDTLAGKDFELLVELKVGDRTVQREIIIPVKSSKSLPGTEEAVTEEGVVEY